jgi:hypothetical protein
MERPSEQHKAIMVLARRRRATTEVEEGRRRGCITSNKGTDHRKEHRMEVDMIREGMEGITEGIMMIGGMARVRGCAPGC